MVASERRAAEEALIALARSRRQQAQNVQKHLGAVEIEAVGPGRQPGDLLP
jgi:hypothetical protein